jgi:molybdate transport system substrate-binding protein
MLALFALGIAVSCERVPERGRVVSVAAAADLEFALDEIAADFERTHPGVSIEVVYGSSGNFHAQLSNRAPFDLFLSADIEYPRKLIQAGHADEESQFLYAVGQIVVWAPASSALDVENRGVEALLDERARKIAIANPRHAPYGRAAESALRSLGVYDGVKDRLVFGENVAQTAHFVESGAADIGVIALSLAMAPAMRDKGRYWLIPLDAYPRMEQGGVILNWAKDREAAEDLRALLMSTGGRATLARYGFLLPES